MGWLTHSQTLASFTRLSRSSVRHVPGTSAPPELIRDESGVPTPDLWDQNLCSNKIHLCIHIPSLTCPCDWWRTLADSGPPPDLGAPECFCPALLGISDLTQENWTSTVEAVLPRKTPWKMTKTSGEGFEEARLRRWPWEATLRCNPNKKRCELQEAFSLSSETGPQAYLLGRDPARWLRELLDSGASVNFPSLLLLFLASNNLFQKKINSSKPP